MALGDDLSTQTTGTLISPTMYSEIINSINFVLRGNMTGAIQANLRTTDIDEHWLICDGRTIGNASSGASARANADMETLFKYIWNNTSSTYIFMADSGGSFSARGASADADWTANKRIFLPDMRGRTLIGLDNGANRMTDTNADNLAGTGGAESVTLTTAQIPSHTHGVPAGYTAFYMTAGAGGLATSGGGSGLGTGANTGTNSGGGGSHTNLQPYIGVNFLICTGV